VDDVEHDSLNGELPVNGEFQTEDEAVDPISDQIDVEMEDVDAPHELDEDSVVVATHPSDLFNDTITAVALSDINSNNSVLKATTNGVKNEVTPPATNGLPSMAGSEDAGPPTPPVSNGDLVNEQWTKVFTDGGVAHLFLRDFRIDGTEITDLENSYTGAPSHASDALSELDDDEMNGLSAAVNEPIKEAPAPGRVTPAKSKKGKAKRKRTGGRSR